MLCRNRIQFVDRKARQKLFDAGNQFCAHTQTAKSHTRKYENAVVFSRHLSAHGNGYARFSGGIDRHRDKAQNGQIEFVVESRHDGIFPVDAERVLR